MTVIKAFHGHVTKLMSEKLSFAILHLYFRPRILPTSSPSSLLQHIPLIIYPPSALSISWPLMFFSLLVVCFCHLLAPHWVDDCLEMFSTSDPKMVICLVKQALVHSFSYTLIFFEEKSPTQWSKHCCAVSKKYLVWDWKSMKEPESLP